ncbi:hypothetical protein ACKKBF_B16135 [Auxenochlorella protothecoides x Auxenochlorella symbiontica]|uniref:GPI transamidase component PIG-S n=2 Tax=Auxenochlorella protothecoides TaxID=3075 RepID=A0A1D2A4H1_AUXPR
MHRYTSRALVLASCWLMYLTGAGLAWRALVDPRGPVPRASLTLQALALGEDEGSHSRPPASCAKDPVIAVTLIPMGAEEEEPSWLHTLGSYLASELARALPGSLPQIKPLHAPPLACAEGACSTGDLSTLGELAWQLQLAGMGAPEVAVSVILLLQAPFDPHDPALQVLGPSPDGDLVIIVQGRGQETVAQAAEAVADWMGRRDEEGLARWCRGRAARSLTGLMAAAGLRSPSPALAAALQEADAGLCDGKQSHAAAIARAAELAAHPDMMLRPAFPPQHAAAVVMPLALPMGLVLMRHTARTLRDGMSLSALCG